MKQLTLGSLFDGSGGFPLGGLLCGITPIWASEVEPFPIRVTTKRMPFIKHYGDISKLDGAKIEPVDIITFGSPCQDMSIAGKRNGLDGNRSSLFYEAIRVIKEMREKTNGEKPRYIVWENVPGAFSSNKGEDFRCVLESICKIKDEAIDVPKPQKWLGAGKIVGDDFSLAWRTLDAQYWGVPQRRRRIYLVADFNGECADKILFESECLPRDFEQSKCTGQGTSTGIESSSDKTVIDIDEIMILNDQGGNRMDLTMDKTTTLRAEAHHPPLVFENHSQDSRYTGPLEKSQTISTGGNNQPLVTQFAFGICSKDSNAMKSSNPHSGIYKAETTRTLDANGGNPACNQGGIAVVEGNGTRPSHRGNGCSDSDVMYTLNTVARHSVAYGIDRPAMNQGKNAKFDFQIEENLQPTIVSRGPGGVAQNIYSTSKASYHTIPEENLANTLVATDYKDPPTVNEIKNCEYIVRRLTPTECARLQGFPDWWCDNLETEDPSDEEISFWNNVFKEYQQTISSTARQKTKNQIIRWLKNPHSDSAEYKMWGNGVALPCVVFVLSGICHFNIIEKE